MSGKLAGKVAFITGAARGQGRAHALRLAEEGADIIAVDIAKQINSVPYPMSTPADLEQTVKEVEALGRRIVAAQADVRDFAALKNAVDAGVSELGRLDIIVANAGISSYPGHDDTDPLGVFGDLIAVNLAGVRHTVQSAVQYLIDQGEGGAIVLTSSAMGLSGRGGNGGAAMEGYGAAKHGVVGLMRTYANWLGPHRIRVNSVHPAGVRTPMIMNDAMAESMASFPDVAVVMTNLLPVEVMEPEDVSNAVAFLVSDDARYITGVALPVDAGFTVK